MRLRTSALHRKQTPRQSTLRASSGSFAKLTAMRRASSRVSSLAAVGPGEQLRMNFEAKRLGGLEVFVGKGGGL